MPLPHTCCPCSAKAFWGLQCHSLLFPVKYGLILQENTTSLPAPLTLTFMVDGGAVEGAEGEDLVQVLLVQPHLLRQGHALSQTGHHRAQHHVVDQLHPRCCAHFVCSAIKTGHQSAQKARPSTTYSCTFLFFYTFLTEDNQRQGKYAWQWVYAHASVSKSLKMTLPPNMTQLFFLWHYLQTWHSCS